MSKIYRDWEPRQSFLLPPSPLDWLPEGHLAYFILDIVEQLDLSEIEQPVQHKDPRGNRPFNPKMMVALLLYGYCIGVASSRKIEMATYVDVAFRVIAGGTQPDHTVISEFRRFHLVALERLFLQVLRLCQAAGLMKLGHVALDGTKVQANASKHKAMSYDRMIKTEIELKVEITRLLERAGAVDQEEDIRFGKEGRGEDLPAELRRRESRLKKIQEAKEALEAEAALTRALELKEQAERSKKKAAEAKSDPDPRKAETMKKRADRAEKKAMKAAERARQKAEARVKEAEKRAEAAKLQAQTKKEQAAHRAEQRSLDAAKRDLDEMVTSLDPDGLRNAQPSSPQHRVPATIDGMPDPKAQRNFTDPDSRIMKAKTGFLQGYNAQIAVDAGCQIIVAYDVTNQSPDAEHLPSMLQAIEFNCCQMPERLTADAGYCSEENIAHAEKAGIDAYFAAGRQKHGQNSETDKAPDPAEESPLKAKAKMQIKLRTEEGRAIYSRRKVIAEPPFGQIKEARGFRRFMLRGIKRAKAEWGLIAMGHNLLKLFRATKVMVPA